MAEERRIEVEPVTPDRWGDLETLFGPRGACGGCWCMSWRVDRKTFANTKGEDNRRALRALVDSGTPPGLIAYVDGTPAGWCTVAPREEFVRLDRSRTLARVDDAPVWSVPCFFVGKSYRGLGVTRALLRAAAEFARARGGRILEGYPNDTGGMRVSPPVWYWTGFLKAFADVGFAEVARRSPKSPIVRLPLAG